MNELRIVLNQTDKPDKPQRWFSPLNILNLPKMISPYYIYARKIMSFIIFFCKCKLNGISFFNCNKQKKKLKKVGKKFGRKGDTIVSIFN
jgi:hypothetical protein